MFFPTFHDAISFARNKLLSEGREVDAGSWQGYKTQGKPDLMTLELINLQLEVPIDSPLVFGERGELEAVLAQEIKPNLPWADDHFAERVSREPSNPGEAYLDWPWWQGQEGTTMRDSVFTHTYQERFWPHLANAHSSFAQTGTRKMGIRYEYGDLDDVVNLLAANPYTRQATFPIFFPEDTGAVHGGRIPCTLHYHFLLRSERLHLWYPIRSCDLVRHFRDDLYMACRLLLWVIQELTDRELRSDTPQLWVDARPGTLFFTAYSFHVHKGDLHHATK